MRKFRILTNIKGLGNTNQDFTEYSHDKTYKAENHEAAIYDFLDNFFVRANKNLERVIAIEISDGYYGGPTKVYGPFKVKKISKPQYELEKIS